MARKQKFDGGTANEIARVAVKEFFEKGFDGYQHASIADAAGCEAGLIYYYYKTKDDLFSTVLDNFFSPVSAARRNHRGRSFTGRIQSVICVFQIYEKALQENSGKNIPPTCTARCAGQSANKRLRLSNRTYRKF